MRTLGQRTFYAWSRVWNGLASGAFSTRFLVVLMSGFLLFSFGYGIALGGHLTRLAAMGREYVNESLSASGFVIRAVIVEGRQQLPRNVLRRALGPVPPPESSLLLDIDTLRTRIEQLGWIEKVSVFRLLPDRLQVVIHERKPFARWMQDETLFLVDHEGNVITDEGVDEFAALPLIMGAGAPRNAGNFFNKLSELPDLSARVRVAVRISDRRWNLRLDSGADVYLPESDPVQALRYLMTIDRSHQILTRNLDVIDLRLPDRVAIRVGDGENPALPEVVTDYSGESAPKLVVTGGRRT